jgi:tetratricopeptide (TPR) repeat protein
MEEAILAGDAPAASSRASDRAAARALRGDIDAILARALQREPGRRYASADAFADDIVRYLEGEVVRAKPDTPWYRLRKSLARHRLGFVFVVVLSMTILTGGTAFVVQAQRARDAAIRAQQVTLFVADVFRANAPGPQRHAGRLPEEGLLDMSARLIETRFAAEPALQAELYGVVAGIFSDMGASNSAADYVSRQLRALASANAPAGELAGAHLALARALFDEERLPDADAHARQALELGRRNILLKQDALLLLARIHTEQNNREEAARYTHLLGQFEPKRGTLQAWIKALEARRLDLDNRLEEAVPLFHQAVDLAMEAEGPDSPTTIDIRLQALGPCPDDQLHFVRHLVMPAIAALRRRGGAHLVRAEWIRAMRPDLFIDESPSANHPGMSIPDSIAIVEASRDSLRRQPMRVPEWMMAMIDMQLAGSKAYYGDIDTASALVADAGGWISKVAESREFAFRRVETLIGVAARSGRHDEVEQLLVQREAVLRGASNPNHPGHVVYYTARAMNLSTAGRHAEAENILNQAPHFDLLRDGTSYPDLADLYMLFYRARIALNRGDPQPALDLPTDRQLAGKGDVSLVTLALMKGEALCATGQARPGLRMLQDEVARISPLQHPNSPTLAYVRSQAGLCAFKSGDKRLARNLAREAREAFVAQPGVSPFYKAPLKSLEQSLRLHLPPV